MDIAKRCGFEKDNEVRLMSLHGNSGLVQSMNRVCSKKFEEKIAGRNYKVIERRAHKIVTIVYLNASKSYTEALQAKKFIMLPALESVLCVV